MLLDISQPVTPTTAGFPGDVPFSCGWTGRLADGDSVNVGWVKTSPHVGTHVDAPYHYDDNGARLGALHPERFIGPAIVIDARGEDALDAHLLDGLDLRKTPRVLFRTQETTRLDTFNPDFPTLTENAITRLASANVKLIGIDAPSVDTADSKTLPIHHALGKADITNIENLLLDHVEPGTYELLAAPVRWTDMDAAPLRAILRK